MSPQKSAVDSPRLTGSLWPLVITLIGVSLLLALGTWQLLRMAEKNTLLQRIEAQAASAVAPLPSSAVDPEEWEYRKASVTGVFLHDQEIHLYAIGPGGRPGFYIITPLIRENGLPVFVNRGWVPEAMKGAESRLAGQIDGIIEIVGSIAGTGSKSRFTPENDLLANRWYHADPEEMAVAVGLGRHLPVLLNADTPNPGGYPKGGVTVRRPANNHLLYAITWYCLALGLAGVFLAYHKQSRA